MKRIIIAFFIILIGFILQTTIFPAIAIGGIVPNILILITSIYGMMRGDRIGIIVGFICGLLADVFFGNLLGLCTFIYMFLGFICGKFHQVFYPDDFKLPAVILISSDLIYGISYYLMFFMLRGRFDFSYYLVNIILPELVYTTVVAVVVYPLMLLGEKHLIKKEMY